MIFLSALALLALLALQIKTICYYKWKRFIFYYAEAVCIAFQEHGNIIDAYIITDKQLSARHPEIYARHSSNNQFRKETAKRVRHLCSDRYLNGAGRIPPRKPR